MTNRKLLQSFVYMLAIDGVMTHQYAIFFRDIASQFNLSPGIVDYAMRQARKGIRCLPYSEDPESRKELFAEFVQAFFAGGYMDEKEKNILYPIAMTIGFSEAELTSQFLPECPKCGYRATDAHDPLLTAYGGLGECPNCGIIIKRYQASCAEGSTEHASSSSPKWISSSFFGVALLLFLGVIGVIGDSQLVHYSLQQQLAILNQLDRYSFGICVGFMGILMGYRGLFRGRYDEMDVIELLLALFLGIAMGFFLVNDVYKQCVLVRGLRVEGTIASAQILRLKEENGLPKEYSAKYQFVTAEHVVQKGFEWIKGASFFAQLRVGEQIRIRYLEDEPGISRIVGNPVFQGSRLLFFGVFFGSFFWLMWFGLIYKMAHRKRGKRPRRKPRTC